MEKHLKRRLSKGLTRLIDTTESKGGKAKIYENGHFLPVKQPNADRFPTHRVGYGQYLSFNGDKEAQT